MANLQEIIINGEIYSHVKTREYEPVSIYRNKDSFLRIGPKDLVFSELNLHKKLIQFDFPVPKIIAEGEIDGRYYYIETSLGEHLLGDIFWKDYKESASVVSESNVKKLVYITGQFARAQIKTGNHNNSLESFYYGAHVDYMIEELPFLKERILEAFEKVKTRISSLPSVLTHGDLNVYNIFEKGIIDFGSSFESPIGYDLVSNIFQTYFFPKNGDFESIRRYEFSEEQISDYFFEMDAIYAENNLPKLSEYANDFLFTRAIWSAVRMEKYPKLQAWRYEKFEKMLNAYVADEGLDDSIFKN